MKPRQVLVAAITLIVGMAYPTVLAGQDTEAKESKTYQGDPLCHGGRGVYPHRVHTPEPEYDNQARKKKIQGTVVLSMIVTKEGRTADIEVTKTLTPGLDKQAVKAVSQWTFEPVIEDGKPCPFKTAVEVDFKLY